MKRLTLLAIALVLAGTAAGQSAVKDSSQAEYQPPARVAYATSDCLEYAVKALYRATDISMTLEEQEKLLNAAEAYERLWTLEQPC